MKKILLALLFGFSYSTTADAERLYGITPHNEIFVVHDAGSPTIVDGPYKITGIETGQSLLAIDFGLHDGMLYGLAYDLTDNLSQLYRIEKSNSGYFAIAVNETSEEMLSNPDLNVAFNFNSAPNVSGLGDGGFEVLDVAVDLRDNPVVVRSPFNNYQNPSLFIYPNPVASQARIVLPAPSASTLYVDIIDLRGERIYSQSFAPGSYLLDVDMGNIPSGLYRLRVIDKAKGIQSIKVVKE